jgi:hypothetical protein
MGRSVSPVVAFAERAEELFAPFFAVRGATSSAAWGTKLPAALKSAESSTECLAIEEEVLKTFRNPPRQHVVLTLMKVDKS